MRLLLRLLLAVLASLLSAAVPAAATSLADSPSLPGRVPAAVGHADPGRSGAWPLLPRPAVASGFDPPRSAWGAGHRGVDLRGHRGQVVRSTLPGTVTFAARLAGRGVVVVDHGGVRTTYEPVDAGVRVGERVGRGAPIGTLQVFASHCFPQACLHWGALRGSTYLDPLTFVGAGPVRLLPLLGGFGPAGALVPASTSPVRLADGRAGRPGAADPW
jgi:murein DD-endopeptidase MepM/ murein hydrolase activator NlpD